METIKKLRRILSITFLIIICLLSASPKRNTWFETLIHNYTLKKGAKHTYGDIIIVKIDDSSIETLGQFPWDRKVYAKALESLELAAIVGFDVIFTEEDRNPESDEAFANTIAKNGNVVLASFATDSFIDDSNNFATNEFKHPLKIFHDAALDVGHINVTTDYNDSFVRRYIPYVHDESTKEYIKSFDIAIYENYMKHIDKRANLANINKNYMDRPYIYFAGAPETFDSISFADLLYPEDSDYYIDPEYFRDRIIIIGVDAKGKSEDAFYVPASGDTLMIGAEIHANIVNNLINNESKIPIPNLTPTLKVGNNQIPISISNFIVVFILGIIAIIIFIKTKNILWELLAFVTLILSYLAIYYISFNLGYILQIMYPILTIIILFILDILFGYAEQYVQRKQITDIFGRYMSPQVIDKIIEEGEDILSLGGLRREITVMFVDIRGFTTMSEVMTPEEVVEILNKYLDLITTSIFSNQGMLDKYIGDAAMALFNVPYNLEDHTLHAVKAAIDMRNASEKLYEELMSKFNKGVKIGIGINRGFAVVGNIGTRTRMDYTAIGDAVNIASRLESNAKAGQILVSNEVYEIVKNYVTAEVLGDLHVKGRVAPILTHNITGLKNH